MISVLQRRSYKETLIILNELRIIEKIPSNLLEKMQSEQDNNWNFKYDAGLPLESQNILKNTAELLSIIYLMFVCKDDNEKEILYKIYFENEKIYNENTKTLYKSNNIMKKEIINEEPKEDISGQMIEYKKSIFNEIINKIKKFFQKSK